MQLCSKCRKDWLKNNFSSVIIIIYHFALVWFCTFFFIINRTGYCSCFILWSLFNSLQRRAVKFFLFSSHLISSHLISSNWYNGDVLIDWVTCGWQQRTGIQHTVTYHVPSLTNMTLPCKRGNTVRTIRISYHNQL